MTFDEWIAVFTAGTEHLDADEEDMRACWEAGRASMRQQCLKAVQDAYDKLNASVQRGESHGIPDAMVGIDWAREILELMEP